MNSDSADKYCVPIELITQGLNVDKSIFEVFRNKEYNSKLVEAVAKRIGNDLSTYDNMICAGRMLLFDINWVCGNITNYTDLMSHRLNKMTYDFLIEHRRDIEEDIEENYLDDYLGHDLFSASTMIKTYLLRPSSGEDAYETMQQMYYRIAIQTHAKNGWDRVLRCKTNMSKGYYTGASPTLFSAGTKKPQMASCFVAGTQVCTLNGCWRSSCNSLG